MDVSAMRPGFGTEEHWLERLKMNSEFPATGKVIAVKEGAVVFQPANTKYELELKAGGAEGVELNQRVQCMIRVQARKVYTVPSGGNFIAPIFGTPRTIQGRVRFVDGRTMVVQAGTSIIVELPTDPAAIDLGHGPIVVGGIVNVVALPGARLEWIAETVAS